MVGAVGSSMRLDAAEGVIAHPPQILELIECRKGVGAGPVRAGEKDLPCNRMQRFRRGGDQRTRP